MRALRKVMRGAAGIALVVVSAGAGACGSGPEVQSGADAYRNAATALVLDEWITDDVDRDGGDTTDWKRLEVDGPGTLTVTVKAEAASARLELAVFDRLGVRLERAKGAAHGEGLTVTTPFERGPLFVQVAHRDGKKTVYSVRAALGGGGGGGSGPDL